MGNMKVFATLATVLGASTATPLFQNQLHSSNDMRLNQHSMQSVMKPSMGVSMKGQISQHDNVDRRMNTNHQMSNLRDMYRDNHDMTSNMMGQENSSNTRDMHKQDQAIGFTGPNQYFVKDNFGNYVYSYNDQQSEKSEEGNNQSIKGQYAYVIRDNADPARIKRSTEPDLLQTRMTSLMDSSSLRDDARDMHLMGRDRASNMEGTLMGIGQQRYSNVMGRDSLNRNIMGQDTMGRNMMGRNIYNVMSNRGMTSDISNMMGQQMNPNMVGRDMSMNMMSRNMMGQDRTPNTVYSNMMGQDMMDMSNNKVSSNMINSRGMSSNSHINNGLAGQLMMQKMETKRVPETFTSSRLF